MLWIILPSCYLSITSIAACSSFDDIRYRLTIEIIIISQKLENPLIPIEKYDIKNIAQTIPKFFPLF